MKLGDKLFNEENKNKLTSKQLQEYAKDMDPKLLQQMIERDSPELNPMLQELQQSINYIHNFLKPSIEKLQSGPKNLKQYLHMQHNLMLSYCSFMIFYLLLKVEGKSTEKHPVIYKLAHIKTLFEKMKPLDEKVN